MSSTIILMLQLLHENFMEFLVFSKKIEVVHSRKKLLQKGFHPIMHCEVTNQIQIGVSPKKSSGSQLIRKVCVHKPRLGPWAEQKIFSVS